MRRALALSLLLAALPLPAHGDAPVPEVVVAVLDTGADGLHAEFGGYLGQPGVADPQIVAWWDFGSHGNPAPGQRWDPAAPVPTDAEKHGTGTASLVGGLTLGTCPGVKLAIARLSDHTGALTGDVAQAIQWATKTVGARVLSMSFGNTFPVPARLDDMDEALWEARALGALPVASAGNGVMNYGVKQPSEFSGPGNSPHVLSVGAGFSGGSATGTLFGGTYANLDPEVTAWGTNVPMAKPGGGTTLGTGTSFSAPKVAGHAACLIRAALAAGQDASPDRIEALLLGTARDTPLPYAIEGYGFVDPATYEQARSLAVSGAPAPGGSAEARAAHAASEAFKRAWGEGEPPVLLVPRAGQPGEVAEGAAGAGLGDGELWTVHAAPGQVLSLRLAYHTTFGGENDVDLYLLRPGAAADGVLSMDEALGASINPAGMDVVESLEFHAGLPGAYVVLVQGYAVGKPQPFALEAWLDGAPAPLAWGGDHLLMGLM